MTPRLIAPLRLAAALFAAAPEASAAASAPKHLILIMMENHGTDTPLGNKEDAPFLTELVTEPGVRFATQYYGVTHPSLPNYLALIAGDEMGIHDDCKAGADIKCKAAESPQHGRIRGGRPSLTRRRRGRPPTWRISSPGRR